MGSTTISNRWLVIAHEATNSGAPRMLLETLKSVRAARGSEWECEMIFNHGGVLLDEFAQYGKVLRLSVPWADGSGLVARMFRRLDKRLPFKPERFAKRVAEWRGRGGGLIYSNTGTNGRLLAALPSGVGPVVSHIHELLYSLRRFNRPPELAATLARTNLFLAVSAAAKEDLLSLGVADERVKCVPNFLQAIPERTDAGLARDEVRRRLGLPEEARFIVACGHIDPVKGTDIFVDVANAIAASEAMPPVFVWVGGNERRSFARRALARCSRPGLVRFVGEVDDPSLYFAASDAVLVTSRAESFSRVALEAGALGRPVLAFASARGPAELLTPECLVGETTAVAMAEALRGLLADSGRAASIGEALRKRIASDFIASEVMGRFLEIMESPTRANHE